MPRPGALSVQPGRGRAAASPLSRSRPACIRTVSVRSPKGSSDPSPIAVPPGVRRDVVPQPAFVVAEKRARMGDGHAVRQGQGRRAAGLRHPQDHAARARVPAETNLDRRLADADGVGHRCRLVRPAGAGRG